MTAALPAADSSTPRLQRPPGRSPSPVAVGREPHPPSFCPPGEVQMFSTSAPRTPTAGRFARFNPAWPKWTQRGSAAGGDQSTPGGSSASRRLSHTEHNCLELPGSQKAEHVGAAPRGGRQPGNTARLGALVCYLLHHLVAKANSAEISRRSCSWTRREASLYVSFCPSLLQQGMGTRMQGSIQSCAAPPVLNHSPARSPLCPGWQPPRTQFSGHGGDGSMVGPDDLSGLYQPWLFSPEVGLPSLCVQTLHAAHHRGESIILTEPVPSLATIRLTPYRLQGTTFFFCEAQIKFKHQHVIYLLIQLYDLLFSNTKSLSPQETFILSGNCIWGR